MRASARKGEHQGPCLKAWGCIPFCPFGCIPLLAWTRLKLHCWLSSHPAVKCWDFVFVCMFVVRKDAGTDPCQRQHTQGFAVVGKVCLVTSPKTVFVCIWLLLIVCSSPCKVFGMTVPIDNMPRACRRELDALKWPNHCLFLGRELISCKLWTPVLFCGRASKAPRFAQGRSKGGSCKRATVHKHFPKAKFFLNYTCQSKNQLRLRPLREAPDWA